ncbi:histidinol-phosphate transaminase [Fulvivirga sp. M361]|uniref:histidinol-phosphate transaminase n=1 Tax=Fulvivirga sp. M361 TaxID=2594266 RepID=UPI00117A5CDD|nr:histidinol-phosphate transaminase [Fulvivirga sp. M361]TRX52369.1 histidinol-phosphate transaminase [Fulvivirga sp. M361]
MDLTKFIRPNILKMKAYSSARDEFEGEGEVFLDANENPYETGINRYPDPYQRALKKKVAALKNIAIENTFLGNGSDEAIDLILRIFCEPGKDKILTTDPTYGMYEVSAAIQNVETTKVPLNELFELSSRAILDAADEFTKVIFICTPHNPTGTDLAREELIQLLKKFNGLVVIDEAYVDFTDQPSFVNDLKDYPNLIVLQTFSKAWGMAGLRLGMAFASEEIIDYFNKVKPPYNLNILTQKEALSRLDNKPGVDRMIRELMSEKEKLSTLLQAFDFVLKVYPSAANFLLVKFKDSSKAFHYLLEHDVIVRDRSKALHCENCLRITIGTVDENKELIATLNSFQALTD